jgi:hypothetical protein
MTGLWQRYRQNGEDGQKYMENMKVENDRLKNALGCQGHLPKQHQMYFEKVDAKNRENNLILTGVPEGFFLSTESDGKKVDKILEINTWK